MLPDNTGKICFCNKIQHAESGIMQLLSLYKIPQLRLAYSTKPQTMHLGIHTVKLFRLKSWLLNQKLLAPNLMTYFLIEKRRRHFHKIAHHHQFNCNPHINHLPDIIQIEKCHISSRIRNRIHKPLLLQSPKSFPDRSPGNIKPTADFIFTDCLSRFQL